MPFNFSVLRSKTQVDGKIDLLSNYLKIDYEKVIIDEWILVDSQSAMLLDLISFAMYGTENYSDLLKKFNRIDNPLEIAIGQILAVPNIESLEANSTFVDLSKSTTTKNIASLSSSRLSQLLQTPGKKTIPSSNFIRSENGNFIF